MYTVGSERIQTHSVFAMFVWCNRFNEQFLAITLHAIIRNEKNKSLEIFANLLQIEGKLKWLI